MGIIDWSSDVCSSDLGLNRAGPAALPCRPGCGACCSAPSISSPMPKMPDGKPAGQRCAHLNAAMQCELFGCAERPAVCGSLQPSSDMCGATREHALAWLQQLERLTRPNGSDTPGLRLRGYFPLAWLPARANSSRHPATSLSSNLTPPT